MKSDSFYEGNNKAIKGDRAFKEEHAVFFTNIGFISDFSERI